MSDSPTPSLLSRDRSRARDWIVVFVVELGCLMCGRTIGTFETRCWPWFGPVLLKPLGKEPAVAVRDWSRLRCPDCGGNVYPDEVRPTKLYPPVSVDDLNPPRRGRPAQRLVEQRQAAPVALED